MTSSGDEGEGAEGGGGGAGVGRGVSNLYKMVTCFVNTCLRPGPAKWQADLSRCVRTSNNHNRDSSPWGRGQAHTARGENSHRRREIGGTGREGTHDSGGGGEAGKMGRVEQAMNFS